MSSSLNNLSPYPALNLPTDISSQSHPTIKNEVIESSKENYVAFVKDIFQESILPKGDNRIENIEYLLDKHGFKENGLDSKGNNMPVLLRKLEDTQSHVMINDGSLSQRNDRIDAVSDQLNAIRNDIRNQTLYRRSASAPLMATATLLEKESVDRGELSTGTSYAEMWLRIAVFIGEVKDEYVDFYAGLMQKYTEMYESFNENVQKASSEAVSTGDDGNNVAFDTKKMQAGYDAFQKDVDRMNSELGSVKGWDNMTEEQRNKEKLVLEPAFKVDERTGKISFNMNQYDTVSGTYPSGIKNGKVSTASYQAWLATFNSAGNAFQSNMQSFAQRYTQANNSFDTLNKILSSAISSTADSARECIRAWG